MSNLNRDYLVKINIKEGNIETPKMVFWNTDKKTSNMFIKLVINMSENELIKQYVTVQNATDYKVILNVIKPKSKNWKTLEADLLNESEALFSIDLPDEFKDQVGDYTFEFEVSSKVEGIDETITTASSTYTVNPSILTGLNKEIESDPDLPILKELINRVENLQGANLSDYQKITDSTLETTDKTVPGAINELKSDLVTIANEDLVIGEDGKLYIEQGDGTKKGIGVEIPTGTAEVPSNVVLFENDETEEDVITAENIKLVDTNNNFSAINVEGALSELFQSASSGKELIANAITGKGVETNKTDSFQTMATNITNISKGSGITPIGTLDITQNGIYNVTNYASANVNVSGSSSDSIISAIGTYTVETEVYQETPNIIEIEHGLGKVPTKVFTFPLSNINSVNSQLGFYGDSNINLIYRGNANGLNLESTGISSTSKYIKVDENKIYLQPNGWQYLRVGTYCWIAV